jgi:hypothetical protein
MTANPAARRRSVTVSILVDGGAADLVGDDNAGEDVWDGAGEVDVWPLSAAARVGSGANWAETPDEFEHVEVGVPTPETKFTAMHCS